MTEKIKENRLNAFVNVDEGAGAGQGPLIAIEDSFAVKGQISSAGSRMLADFRPPYQAEAVDRLLKAGYSLIAHTNMGEFHMAGTESSYYGPTVHPLDEARISGGAAAAVADDAAEAALITDLAGAGLTDGALAGCAAFRPTYGAVSRFGVIPCVCSVEQAAAVAKSVDGAAKLLQAAAGFDEKDATSLQSAGYDFSVGNAAGKRIALVMAEGDSPGALAARQAADALKAAGAAVEEVELRYAKYAGTVFSVMLAAEGCNNISRYDGVKFGYRAQNYHNIEELYVRSRSEALGLEAKTQAMLGAYLLSKGQYEPYYVKALQVRRLLRDELKALFEKFDAALSPAAVGPAYRAEQAGERRAADRGFGAVPAICGFPAIALSCGEADGLPLAVQLFSGSGKEREILAAAAAVEGGRS